MSTDVIIGYDRKPRCRWAGDGDTALGRYHDQVWGTRTHDEHAPFEATHPRRLPDREQGYRFVGPTSVYAFMQNVGVVNDHLHGCYRSANRHREARCSRYAST